MRQMAWSDGAVASVRTVARQGAEGPTARQFLLDRLASHSQQGLFELKWGILSSLLKNSKIPTHNPNRTKQVPVKDGHTILRPVEQCMKVTRHSAPNEIHGVMTVFVSIGPASLRHAGDKEMGIPGISLA